jgi:hypothetical protein
MWIVNDKGNIRNWLRSAKLSTPKSVNKKGIGIVSSDEMYVGFTIFIDHEGP